MTTIESILSWPDKKKETRHNLILSMSNDIGRGYQDLKKAMWWAGKQEEKKKKGNFIISKQLSVEAEKREETRKEKRKN